MIKITGRAGVVPFHFFSRLEPDYLLTGMQNTNQHPNTGHRHYM